MGHFQINGGGASVETSGSVLTKRGCGFDGGSCTGGSSACAGAVSSALASPSAHAKAQLEEAFEALARVGLGGSDDTTDKDLAGRSFARK